ncbi:hypothetical protein ANO11243_018430 [Dothideomycetidae sp. 11243]|nr:hypothetical protein ANO11243_018430 [fungal sp. No.11243]
MFGRTFFTRCEPKCTPLFQRDISTASGGSKKSFGGSLEQTKSTHSASSTRSSSTTSQSSSLTVVELFQSQGCSSCPPANQNILGLMEDPDKLILTYEVTYWDHLGWKDTFGSSAHDARQRQYASAFNNRSVYTPQVIVNGRAEGVGSSSKDLRSILQRGTRGGAQSNVSVEVVDGVATITGTGEGTALVSVVRYDPNVKDVRIARGENRGRTIPHRNVVRDITVLGVWTGQPMRFPLPGSDGQGLARAVVVQAGEGGPILAAARV